jgi:effector-binding domain-containing protein
MQIVETEKQPVMSVQTTTSVGKMPEVVGAVYGQIVSYILEKGGEPLGPAFIAYYNMDMEHLNVEIGFPVAAEMEGRGDIQLRWIPAGKKATGYHKGPYNEIGILYDKLGSWITGKGYEPTGVVYEYYFNSPEEIPPSELLTKVEFLLK